jgi:UDP-GlcNAc:undecaprenyl-phosphate/decaprenyl-phosphate GlcNAc-1-phosphate transferase
MPALAACWSTYWPYGLLAFAVAFLATPLAIQLARRTGVLDQPDRVLKPHAHPTPYLGGLAVGIGWMAALTMAAVRAAADGQLLTPIVLGGLVVLVLGLIDDVRTVPPRLRLAIAATVVAAVLLSTGVGLALVDALLLLWPAPVAWPAAATVPLSFLASLVIVIAATNSVNLVDGLDGLCSGLMAIVALGFFLLASQLAALDVNPQGDAIRLVLAISMLGAALGFLPFNFNPARIFLGDAGSLLLGYIAGLLIVLFIAPAAAGPGNFQWLLAAGLIFGLPICDTSLVVYLRWRSGRPIFTGDRNHLYDQLRQRGWSVPQTALICYGLAGGYVALGLLITAVHDGQPVFAPAVALGLFAAVAVLTVGWLRFFGFTRGVPAEPSVAPD